MSSDPRGRGLRRRLGSAARLAILAALIGAPSRASAAETDYLPDNRGWNGLSELTSLARGMQLSVELVGELAWNRLGERDVLLIVYPRGRIDGRQLVAFLERGGRALIADDFGTAAPLLGRLGISRHHGATTTGTAHLAHNPALPIATRRSGATHAVTRGVDRVVANHPAYFRSRLPPLLSFDRTRQLLVGGKLGQGIFFALADPSVLINRMLGFSGNFTLARNLLRELATPGRDRLLLVTGYFRARGRIDSEDPHRELGGRLNELLRRLNDFALTSVGMRVLAFVCGGIAVLAVLLVLPLPRRDLDGSWLRVEPRRETVGAAAEAQSIASAAAVLRDEVETALTDLLEAPSPVSTLHPRWIIDKVTERAGPPAGRLCRRLLSVMGRVPYTTRAEGAASTGLKPRDLERLYRYSRQLLEVLDPQAAEALPPLTPSRDGDHR